ncbi:MAG: hypothetical protein ABIR47_10920 [Candidatus Kapaibacterium sp.]
MVGDTAGMPGGYIRRSLEKRYPGKLYDGYDITGAVIAEDYRGPHVRFEYYFRGLSRNPFLPFANLLCVVPTSRDSAGLDAFRHLLDSLGLVEEIGFDTIPDSHEQITQIRIDSTGHQVKIIEVPPIATDGVHVVRLKSGEAFPRNQSPELRALRSNPLISFAGPILTLNRLRITAFDRHLSLHINSSNDTSVVLRTARNLGFDVRCSASITWGTWDYYLTDSPASNYEIGDKGEVLRHLKGITGIESVIHVFEDPWLRGRRI